MCRTADPLPPRALAVLRCIVRYKLAHDGIAPSTSEIMKTTRINSTSYVSFCLDKLEAAGHITRLRDPQGQMLVRGIVVNGAAWQPPEALPVSL